MGLACLLLLLSFLSPTNCMNLEHVTLNASLYNIRLSSSIQETSTTATVATSTTISETTTSVEPVASSHSTSNPSPISIGQGPTTSISERNLNISTSGSNMSLESDEHQREGRIVNRPGQERNQPINVRRGGENRRRCNNRRRGGEQTQRRIETRRRIKAKKEENHSGGSRRRISPRGSCTTRISSGISSRPIKVVSRGRVEVVRQGGSDWGTGSRRRTSSGETRVTSLGGSRRRTSSQGVKMVEWDRGDSG